jgi:hypothetical protein
VAELRSVVIGSLVTRLSLVARRDTYGALREPAGLRLDRDRVCKKPGASGGHHRTLPSCEGRRGDTMADEPDPRDHAIRRVKAKRDFKTHVVVYFVVNAMLVVIWAVSGAGYFWPIWSILGWGIGVFFNWWNAYIESRPISEQEIQREMDNRNQRDR